MNPLQINGPRSGGIQAFSTKPQTWIAQQARPPTNRGGSFVALALTPEPPSFLRSLVEWTADFLRKTPATQSVLAKLSTPEVQRTALAITAAFEAPHYSAIQTLDSGIVSYGQYQATLASGTLMEVLQKYWDNSMSDAATALKLYEPQIASRSADLRTDSEFLNLLKRAGSELEMQTAQDEVFLSKYFQPALAVAKNIGLETPLAISMLFDTNVQGGMLAVVKATNQSLENTEWDEASYLQAFLDRRRERLLKLADIRAGQGNSNTAALLRTSAGARLDNFQRLLDEKNFQLRGELMIQGRIVPGMYGDTPIYDNVHR